MTDAPIIVVGTGFAGFCAGYRLESAAQPHIVYPPQPYIGGHAASDQLPGRFLSDQATRVSCRSQKDERTRQILAVAVGGRDQVIRIGLDSYWPKVPLQHGTSIQHRSLIRSSRVGLVGGLGC